MGTHTVWDLLCIFAQPIHSGILLDFFKSEKDGIEEVINLDAFSRIPVLPDG